MKDAEINIDFVTNKIEIFDSDIFAIYQFIIVYPHFHLNTQTMKTKVTSYCL